MDNDNEIEDTREIIKVRRLKPKKKEEEKKDENELKEKIKDAQKKRRRTQVLLALAIGFIVFLGLRSLGCFSQSNFPTTDNSPRSLSSYVPRLSDPLDSNRQKSETSWQRADATQSSGANFENRNFFSSDSPTQNINDEKNPNAESRPVAASPIPENLRVVRIATWNLDGFDFQKLSNSEIALKIAKLTQEFDVVAFQGIYSKNRAVLEGLEYLIAQQGGKYSYIATDPDFQDEIAAIFYDREALEIDRSTLSEIFDSAGRLPAPGLTAAFRPSNVPPQNCFTFQIIDLRLDQNTKTNGAALADLYRTLKNQTGALGIAEDDLLLVGDFGDPIAQLQEFAKTPNLVAIHAEKQTDENGGTSANILFDSTATIEYVERFGVVDLAEYFDISSEEAKKIATGRPIWADFSVFEGADAQFSTSRRLLEESQKNSDAYLPSSDFGTAFGTQNAY